MLIGISFFYVLNRVHIFNLFVIVRMFLLLFSVSNDESKLYPKVDTLGIVMPRFKF